MSLPLDRQTVLVAGAGRGLGAAIAAATPLGRVTTPEEMADAAPFFASPLARAVAGQNLIVDGGLVSG